MYMMREYRNGVLRLTATRVIQDEPLANSDNRCLVEFNFGYNGSERLAKEDRFEFFPAASLGWVLSRSSFGADCRLCGLFQN